MKQALHTLLVISLFASALQGQNNTPPIGGWGNSVNDSALQKPVNNAVYLSRQPSDNLLQPSKVGDGSGNLNPTYFVQNVCGLNFTQASQLTETRTISSGYNTNGTGFPTTVTVSGLPASCMIVQKAYLYYTASYTESSAPSTTATVLNPAAVSNTYASTTIGTGPAKGWGETGSAAYRADVTAIISGNGVYTITLNGFANPAWEVDGVTLFIVYASGPSANATGSLIIIDGIISTSTSNSTETVSGFDVCAASTATAFGVYGDIQANDNGNTNTDIFNGTTASFANNFWNFNQIATPVTTGQATTQFESYTNNGTNASDDFAWIMAGIYWNNTTCSNCKPVISLSTVQPNCGYSNGASDAITTGGSPPFTYTWSPYGGTNATATGLSGGTFTVTVEDALCNTATASVVLTNTPLVVVTGTETNVKCNGGITGTAKATVTSGSSPYVYLWMPGGSTTANIGGLSAGTYTVVVTDAKSCTGTAVVTITQPPALTSNISSIVNEMCHGGTNGSANVNVSGGSPAYTYSWAPGGKSTAGVTGLSAGTYTVIITDANGCTSSNTVTITQPASMITTFTYTEVPCNGNNTGGATVSVSGGFPAYTYSWAPGGKSTSTVSGLSAGIYTLTITDANGCTKTGTVDITQPPVLTISITAITNLTCFGSNSGIETATASGGNPSYTYSWSPGGYSNSFATGLSAGTYTVKVTDASGCTATASASITQPPVLTSTITSTVNVSCFGGRNGSATISASGGTPVYTYSWSPGGNTNSSATGMSAGTYTIFVRDAKGCTSTAIITITQPNSISPTISSITNDVCNGGNTGSATVSMTGGTSPFTYAWMPGGQSGATATGLSAGTYTVKVTDALGCSETADVTITEPTPITDNITTTFGCNNGSGTAFVTASGGTPVYTYLWSPGGITTVSATGLNAGNYTLTIMDANGCTHTTSVVLTQPNALTITLNDTNLLCNNTNTGSASVIVTGGTPAYTYLWNPGGGTSTSLSGLSAGTYTITVTDALGCRNSDIISITQPPALSESVSVLSNENCNGGSTGSASITISGGTPVYTYNWQPGGLTSSNVSGLQAGEYIITVTDADGCQVKDSVDITQPTVITTTSTITPTNCYNMNGGASVTASGGTPGYHYSWSPGGQTTAAISGLTTGTYTLTITDSKGCTLIDTIVVPTASANIAASGSIFCSGGNTGNLTVSMNGGVSPYTYLWLPGGETTDSVSGLPAGSYTVIVTDAIGCIDSATILISQPPPLTTSISNITNLLCNGDSIGKATLKTIGGTSPYIYSWSPGRGSTAAVSGLGAGMYTVYVTDADGCHDTVFVTITEPVALSVHITTTGQILCNGASGVTATVSTSGGTSPYSYSWYPIGKTTSTVTGLKAGTDSVITTDANGCTGYAVLTITQPPLLTVTVNVVLANCGLNNGSLTSIPGGGTGAYTYSWAPGGLSTASITGLSIGIYTLTITDANGCTVTSAATVRGAFDSLTSVTNVSCNGGSNGKATVKEFGGTSPYTYLWAPGGQTTSTVTGLSAGIYTITIKDAHGCSVSTTITISQPQLLTSLITINSNVLCHGGNTGSATVSVTGGTSPYTYLWAPGGSTTANATGLSAGRYTVTVTDLNGCRSTGTVVITQALSLGISIIDNSGVLCNGGSTGSAQVGSFGGTQPYTYQWIPGGQSTANASGLSAGIYTVTVHDSDGCTGSTIITITQPAVLISNIASSTNITCNGLSDGSATASGTGGSSPYTYSWSPGPNSNASVSGLSAGVYTVSIIDSNGCMATVSVNITEPSPLSSTISSSVNIKCYGGANGSAIVANSGGNQPYTYSWSPTGGNSIIATGLSAGTYTIYVTDADGCTSSASVTLTQPNIFSVSILQTAIVPCNGGNSASLSSTITGGTAPYTYVWMPSGHTTAAITGLSAGTFTLTVSDANGCSASDIITITQPGPLIANFGASVNILCNGQSNGKAIVSANGGTMPYTYFWSPGGNTNTSYTGLSIGTYTVTITDSNGCKIKDSITLTQPPVLNLSVSATTNLRCANVNNGKINVTVSGGSPAYTYSWFPGGQTTAAINRLSAGTYSVVVTDSNGCSVSKTITLTEPPLLTDSTSATPTSCGSNSGTASVYVTGGTPLYVFSWSPGGQTNSFATGLSAGTYTVKVTDANGCTATATAFIYNSAPTLSTSTSVRCNGGANGSATITIAGGSPPYTYLWSPTGQTKATATGLSAGTYTVDITDATGCNVIDSITISQPPLLVVSLDTAFMVTCNGANTGSASFIVTGGSPSYNYSWTPGGQTSDTATGLSAGTYTVFVVDANGCTGSDSITITQPTPIVISIITNSPVSCNGGNNGSCAISVSGGFPSYIYSWSPGGATSTSISGLTAGIYTITVTDSMGCIKSDSVIITQPRVLVATITGILNVSCHGPNSGGALVTASGGTSPYTYSWTTIGNTTAFVSGLSVGTYSVSITDSNGCTASTSVIISQAAPLTSTITSLVNVLCNGGTSGSASARVAGGTPPYTYSWSPGGNTSATFTGLSAGTYTLYVTDSLGCPAGDTITITQPLVLAVTAIVNTNVSCNGGSNGSALANVSGGTSPYTYLWTLSGGSNSSASGLSAGTYTISVTDFNGCISVDSITITQPPVLTATISSFTNLLCNGINTGSATALPGGGTSPYTYSWSSPGGSNSGITGLSIGSYTITITDTNGCTATTSVILTQPPALTVSTSTTFATCGNSNGSVSVIAGGGTGAYTYSWAPIAGTTDTLNSLNAGTYTITITDANGCTIIDSGTVIQLSNFASSISASVNELCFGGNNGSATASVSGGFAPYTYLWSPSGQTTANASGLSAGTYTVIVSDSIGCSQTNTINITQPTVLSATFSANIVNELCFGGNNGIDSVRVTGGTSPYAYLWLPTGGTNAQATGLTAGTYTVNITDINGCTTSAVNSITQPQLLVVSIASVNESCNGDSNASVTALASGGTPAYIYSWSPGGSTNISISGLRVGIYTVNVIDSNGCTASNKVIITEPATLTGTLTYTKVSCYSGTNGTITAIPTGGTSPYTYSWVPVGQSGSTATQLSAGSYTVYVTDNHGCNYFDTLTLTQPTALVVSAIAPTIICDGTTGTLTSSVSGGVPPYTYLWSNGTTTTYDSVHPTVTTVFTLTVTDSNNCSDTSVATLFVRLPLSVVITGDSVYCPGQTLTIKATASGGDGFYHYLWLPSNSTLQYATFTVHNDTTLTLEITDNCGTTMITKTININEASLPKVSFASNTATGCSPLCIQFWDYSTIDTGSISTWSWTFGPSDSSNLQNPIHCFRDTGTFTISLTVSSKQGCSSTLTKLDLIRIYAHPNAAFTWSPQPVNILLSPVVQFTDQSTDEALISLWYWKFSDDGLTSTDENPSHTYTDTGTFCASLNITDIHGCTDSVTNCMVVEPLFTFYIPNAFTPNGDNINDIFQPKGTYIRDYKMYVYDRWGQQIFYTDDFNNGWNGRVNNEGAKCQEDTYVYLIYVTDSQGGGHTYTGKVTLVR